MESIQLSVTGMTCGNCVKHVDHAIRAITGVEDVQIDLASGNVSVRGEFAQGLEPIIAALAEEGYPATVKSENRLS
jgi:copper chaperone CopZ